MRSIFVHLSPNDFSFSNEFEKNNYVFDKLPPYANISFNNCEKYLEETPLLITSKDVFSKFQPEIIEFWKLCKENFPSYYRDSFWFLTLLRLHILRLICEKYNIEQFIHMEYDNLIYSDSKIFDRLSDGCYFTQVGPGIGSSGFSYFNNLNKLIEFDNALLDLIKAGENNVKKLTSENHISEMIMIDILKNQSKCEYLPLFSTDKYFDQLQHVFDGASYGQYIGGTNNGHPPGWYGRHHYVGNKIHVGELKIEFNEIPCIIENDKKYLIYNLHIHSKKLDLYDR